MKKFDDKKICFITAVNDVDKYNECVGYLQKLRVPEGMTVESVVVQDAASMTEAYQTGMEGSDAKYKVYLHQDVWITQPNLLEIMVREFRRHPEYGIAGIVGSDTLPDNAIWWEGHMIGTIRDSHTGKMQDYIHDHSTYKSQQAVALDGLLLMTQYDLPWRTELFDKWHFYDVSQCMEFKNKGYQVVVLPQSKPMAIHASGISSLEGYDVERQKFIKEYMLHTGGKRLEDSIKVLVVIPTFNRPKYFREALESVIHQTYANLEIVISDNSTNDLTERLMQSYLSDKRIKYYRHKEFTAKDNWGFLRKYVRESECQYINWLMDDDVFHPDKIRRMLKCYLENENVALVTSHRQVIDGDGKYLPDIATTKRLCQQTSRVSGDEAGSLLLRTRLNFIGEPTTVLLNKKYMKNGDFGWTDLEGDYAAEDYPTFLHALEKGDLIYISDTLSYFRVHGKNLQNNVGIFVRSTICWMIDIQYAFSRKVYLHNNADYRQAAYNILMVVIKVLYRLGANGISNEDTRELWKWFEEMSKQLGEIERCSTGEESKDIYWERIR